ncbi:hypothetical protein LPB19_02665 [Marinobacter salinisoli]|uniref:B box-type domain-containing protein n=1 Tax=Marinobacter salinisoli TaxID=2769486 RepID=A0ABX7MSR1_9GAMM|nr:hypothetical protein [Marinobacter salinisoli]QSP95341.1 hypothetical protein LPB19_02665 [Marinobacter salinisoli]
MKHDCDYHPGDPAKWHCSACQKHYCSRCMPDANPRQRRGQCPNCNQLMRYLGAATQVVPFWKRIGAFFRYPFYSDPLIVIAICTLVPALAPASFVGWLVWVVLAIALLKYTYEVINHTAEGHLKPPPVSVAFTGSGFEIVFLQFLVFFLMGALVSSAGMLGGPILGLIALAFVVLVLPASIMLLATERSVKAAVNPFHLTALIARIGTPYFLLYGYLILLTMASGTAQDFAYTHFPSWLSQSVAGFLNSAFTLILFHMLGYLLFQYQEELGFASDLQDGSEADAAQDRDRNTRFDADLDINLKDGNYDRAQSMLKDALRREPGNALRLGQLYQLLTARNDRAELNRYHPRILAWLAERNDADGMAALLRTLQQADPQFQLDDPELTLRCARTLYHRSQFRQSLKLLQDFHKRFPNSEHLAPAYQLAAQALANGLDQWEKAKAYLMFIHKRCADHPLHGQIAENLKQAERKEPIKEPRASFATP